MSDVREANATRNLNRTVSVSVVSGRKDNDLRTRTRTFPNVLDGYSTLAAEEENATVKSLAAWEATLLGILSALAYSNLVHDLDPKVLAAGIVISTVGFFAALRQEHNLDEASKGKNALEEIAVPEDKAMLKGKLLIAGTIYPAAA